MYLCSGSSMHIAHYLSRFDLFDHRNVGARGAVNEP
jgi:hypothetical protein